MLGKPQPLIIMNGICYEKFSSRSSVGNFAMLVGQDVRVRLMERATARKEMLNDLWAAKREKIIF